MQNYEVIGNHITLGLGIELKLSPSQAETRASSLQKKKNDIYGVIDHVQFKRGEKITVSSGNLSKSVLANLEEISDKKPQENIQYPCVQHVSFGKYNVLDKDGNLLNKKPLKKDEAEKIFSEITKTNQEIDNKKSKTEEENEKEDKKNDEVNDQSNDVNNLPINNQNNV